MGEDRNGQSRLIYGQISPGKAFEHPWAHVFVGGFRNDLRRAPGFANGVVLATKSGVKLGCDHCQPASNGRAWRVRSIEGRAASKKARAFT